MKPTTWRQRFVLLVGLALVVPASAVAQQGATGGGGGGAGSGGGGGGVGTMNSGSGSTTTGFGGSSSDGSTGSTSGSGTQSGSSSTSPTSTVPTVVLPGQSYGIGGREQDRLPIGTGNPNISNTNPFARFYGNPYFAGKPGATASTGGFGVPTFNITQGNRTNNLGGGTAGIGIGSNSMTGARGLNTAVNSRLPGYTASIIGFSPPVAAPAAMQTDLRQVIAAADALTMRDGVQVTVEGNAVVLRGDVADARERRLAENLLRLKPGVRIVRNELQVREILPAPKPLNAVE